GRPAWLQGPGDVGGTMDPVVTAVEGGRVLAEHRSADLQRLLETVQALPGRWEVEAEALVLLLVPGGTDPQDGSSPADDVEGRHHLGDERRVAVGHPGDQRAQLHRARLGRQGTEERISLEHRLAGASQRGELPE